MNALFMAHPPTTLPLGCSLIAVLNRTSAEPDAMKKRVISQVRSFWVSGGFNLGVLGSTCFFLVVCVSPSLVFCWELHLNGALCREFRTADCLRHPGIILVEGKITVI